MDTKDYPTKELLESTISEIRAESKLTHGSDKHDCELCRLSSYLEGMKDDPINAFIGDVLTKLPSLPILVMTEDALDVAALCRSMFLIGLKAGRTQSLTLDNFEISG